MSPLHPGLHFSFADLVVWLPTMLAGSRLISQVNTSRISTPTFAERHTSDSGSLHEDDLLGKARKAISDSFTALSCNMPPLQSMNYEISGDIKMLGGQIDRVQHLPAVFTADTIA